MTFKITSTRQLEETLYTTVKYNFDETIVTIEIPHFAPNSVEEIEANISSRAATELAKIEARDTATGLLSEIQLNVEKEIEE